MASEPGGRADKLGNEFEKLWAVRYLIDLVAGAAVSVRIECLGPGLVPKRMELLKQAIPGVSRVAAHSGIRQRMRTTR